MISERLFWAVIFDKTRWMFVIGVAVYSLLCERSLATEYGWQLRVIDKELRGADGVKVRDVNQDGLPDLVSAWEESGEVRIYLHPGYDVVKEPWPRATVGRVQHPEDAFFADVDANESYDVVSVTERQDRTVYVHMAPQDPGKYLDEEKWKTSVVSTSRPGRFSGLLSYFCDTRIGTYIRVRTGEFTFCVFEHRYQRWLYGVWLERLEGVPGSMFVGAKEHNATISQFTPILKNGRVDTWDVVVHARVGWTMSLIRADVDLDGFEDILFSDRRGVDLDGNGVEDDGVVQFQMPAYVIQRGVHWLRNPGRVRRDDVWRRHRVGGEDYEVMFLDYGDVNGDRLSDIVVATKNGPILLFQGKGKGEFEQYQIPKPDNTGTGKSVAIGDIDLDGKPDLVYSTETSTGSKRGIVWKKNLGDVNLGGQTWHDVSGPKGTKFDRVELLDLDGDGDLDILTTEENDHLGVIWYENPMLEQRPK